MIKTRLKDTERVVEILALAFEQCKSINATIRQDDKKLLCIRHLIRYACRICSVAGKVILSEDRNAAALVIYPDKMRFSLRAMGWAIALLFGALGAGTAVKIWKQQARIKKYHPPKSYYIWFIGVHPVHKNLGCGHQLMEELIADAESKGRPICVETSESKHLAWGLKRGFKIFRQLNMGEYLLYLVKR